MNNEIRLEHLDSDSARSASDELIALYERVWLSGWKDEDEFFSRSRFVDRLNVHLSAPGFELVTARIGGRLAGYMYGFSRAQQDEFAVCELMVHPEHRRRGIGRTLHDELLRRRPEERAQLLVEKENSVALAAYRAWGWRKVADVQPFPDAPNYDSLVLDLAS